MLSFLSDVVHPNPRPAKPPLPFRAASSSAPLLPHNAAAVTGTPHEESAAPHSCCPTAPTLWPSSQLPLPLLLPLLPPAAPDEQPEPTRPLPCVLLRLWVDSCCCCCCCCCVSRGGASPRGPPLHICIEALLEAPLKRPGATRCDSWCESLLLLNTRGDCGDGGASMACPCP